MSEQGRDPASNHSNQSIEDWYDKHAREVNISADTLRNEINIEEWVDNINLQNATKSQLCSYAGCTLAELRITSLQSRDFLQSFQEDFT
jgi:hypothetical protein